MWFKVISMVLFALQLASANLDCDGSALNVDGLVPRPSKNKAGFGEFPWVVALYKKDSAKPHCAGSIIDESTILTTAFCVKQ
jgi:secreted trypsin-like serine protease